MKGSQIYTDVLIMSTKGEMDSRAHWSIQTLNERSSWLPQENQARAAIPPRDGCDTNSPSICATNLKDSGSAPRPQRTLGSVCCSEENLLELELNSDV